MLKTLCHQMPIIIGVLYHPLWSGIMEVFAQLFTSPVGLASFLTIFSVCVIAVYLFFWVKKQTEKSNKS